MTSGVSGRGYFASYNGITQSIRFKTNGKKVRAEVWDKSSGKLLITIDDLFLKTFPGKTTQETLSWMLESGYAFYWTRSLAGSQSLGYHQALHGGSHTELLEQLNDPTLISTLLNDSKRTQSYVKTIQGDSGLVSQLIDFVLASRDKTDPLKTIRAVNSISLLNAAHIPFSGMDLSGINIPGAYLWGAILHRTILDGANLTGVILINAFLKDCSLKEAILRDVQFGERAFLEYPSESSSITFLPKKRLLEFFKQSYMSFLQGNMLSPDGKIRATVSGKVKEEIDFWEEVIDDSGQKTSRHLETIRGLFHTLKFSPDGKITAMKYVVRSPVCLWEVEIDPETQKRKLTFTLSLHSDCIAFSPDGKTVATSLDKEVYIWEKVSNLETGKIELLPLFTLTQGKGIDNVECLEFSPDGGILAQRSEAEIRLWRVIIDATTKKRKFRSLASFYKPPYSDSSFLKFSPNGKVLAVDDGTEHLYLREITEIEKKPPKPLSRFQGHTDRICSLKLSRNGKLFATGGLDGRIILWNGVTNPAAQQKPFQLSQILLGKWDTVDCLELSPDGKMLAAQTNNKELLFFKAQIVEGQKQIFKLYSSVTWSKNFAWACCLAFSPDGRILAAGNENGKVYLFKDATNSKGRKAFQRLAALERANTSQRFKPSKSEKSHAIRSVAFSPSGKILAAITSNPNLTSCLNPKRKYNTCFEEIVLWNIERLTTKAIFEIRVFNHASMYNVNLLTFSPNEEILIAGTKQGNILCWNLQYNSIPEGTGTSFQAHKESVCALAFSSKGKFLASGGEGGTVCLWKVLTNEKESQFQPLVTLKGHADAISSIAFSPDGKILLTSSFDKTIRSWKLFNDHGELAPCLIWESTPDALFAKRALIDKAQELSVENYALLMQRGVLKPSSPLTFYKAPSKPPKSPHKNDTESSESANNKTPASEESQPHTDEAESSESSNNKTSTSEESQPHTDEAESSESSNNKTSTSEESQPHADETDQKTGKQRDETPESETPISKALENAIKKEVESTLDERISVVDEEIVRTNETLSILKGKQKENLEKLKGIIDQEKASLDIEIKNFQKELEALHTWKEEVLKEKKLSEEERLLIEQERKLLEKELENLKEQQKLLSDEQTTQEAKLDPLYTKYSQKMEILKKQKKLTSREEVRVFYKTLEQTLGSKFSSSILLTGGLLQRSSVKKDLLVDAAEYGVEAVFGFIAGAVSVCTLGASALVVGAAAAAAGAAAGKAAGELVSGRIDGKYENRAREVSGIMSNPKYAWGIAELIARRVTTHYLKKLKNRKPEKNKELAEEAGDTLYKFIALGELNKQSYKTEDEMIEILIKKIQSEIEAKENKKSRKGHGCELL